MTIERKVGMGIAGQPSGDAANVAEVFSTSLYIGNGGTNIINNGIDLAGEGGIIIHKRRDDTGSWRVSDTDLGITKNIEIWDGVPATSASGKDVTSFNSNGFTYGIPQNISTNVTNAKSVAWTFRKKEKFFERVTYTGNGSNRWINHSLGSAVGMIWIKRTDAGGEFYVYHVGGGNTGYYSLQLNDGLESNAGIWNNTTPTDTRFRLGTESQVNHNGGTYIAYLFANNSAEDIEDQMIQCGSVVKNSSTSVLSLPWEPQFVLIKASGTAQGGEWFVMDSMRGLEADPSNGKSVSITKTAIETTGGLRLNNKTQLLLNLPTQDTYIYMAIRAPMMKEPEAATDVFSISTVAAGQYTSVGFAPDNVIFTNTTQSSGTRYITTKLTGNRHLRGNTNSAEGSLVVDWDSPSGTWRERQDSANINFFWKRAKGFHDVVAYSGTGAAHTEAHSLGVVPEMMWVKKRTGTASGILYHKDFPINSHIFAFDDNSGTRHVDNVWNDTAPTDSVFSVKTYAGVNNGSHKYVAHLWATLAGISKVGSYTGNGSNQTISCGFSAGARYILIKQHQAAGEATGGDFYIWDTTRGIIAGNDPHLSLNSGAAQITNDDSVDPHNSGFIVNQVSATNINVYGKTYIFYAIA
tara:strand:- start:47 stop:1951 length:1905 start_codon:yes stop_codon:yes gene_type:complete